MRNAITATVSALAVMGCVAPTVGGSAASTGLSSKTSSLSMYAGRWASAFQSGDITQMMSLYHPDALAHGTRTKAVLNGDAAIRKFYEQSFAAAADRQATCQPDAVKQWSADIATIAATCDLSWQSAQNPTAPRSGGAVRLTMTMARSGNAWRIVSQHQSFLPSQTPQATPQR